MGNANRIYKNQKKSDFKAKWICASNDFLEQYNRPKADEFPTAPFMWGKRYTRVHFRRLFKIEGNVKQAYIHLLCDNIIDVYLNGTLISFESKDTGKTDITEHLTDDNILMIRAYQTASPDSFTSAITGGLRIIYENGNVEDILTDESFENVRFINFWVTEEPGGWETDRETNLEKQSQLLVTPMHPIAIKRSCIFRKDFSVSKSVTRATLLSSALGCYEAHINGKTVDNVYFLPSAMDIAKEYQRFDITQLIKPGSNALSAITGNGWYNCSSWGNLSANKPALIMELTLEYSDGSIETIATDETWRIIPSPLVDNDLQFGERYDARLEIPDWDNTNCSTNTWDYASVMDNVPFNELLLQNYPPIRATRQLPVAFMSEIDKGVWLYDCGMNISGAVELTLHNTFSGQRIEIGVCERLTDDGKPELGAYGAVYYQHDTRANCKAPYN